MGLVWFIATIAFFVLRFFLPSTAERFDAWLIFIYAIPVSCIVLIIFNAIYFNKIATMFAVSGLVWTVALSIYLTFIQQENIGLIFIVMIPFQVLVVFFFILLIRKRKFAI